MVAPIIKPSLRTLQLGFSAADSACNKHTHNMQGDCSPDGFKYNFDKNWKLNLLGGADESYFCCRSMFSLDDLIIYLFYTALKLARELC